MALTASSKRMTAQVISLVNEIGQSVTVSVDPNGRAVVSASYGSGCWQSQTDPLEVLSKTAQKLIDAGWHVRDEA